MMVSGVASTSAPNEKIRLHQQADFFRPWWIFATIKTGTDCRLPAHEAIFTRKQIRETVLYNFFRSRLIQ
jgi:hypothetical protein